MKAYVLNGIAQLDYMDVPMPEIPAGWALIKVKSSGICSSDIPRIFSKGTYHFPTIPGHEFSGVVHSVADSENEKWIGKRVCVFPLIPCMKCEQCLSKNYQRCRHYDYIGSRRDGAFAEFVSAPVWNLIELPDAVSFDLGALIEPLSVALHSVNRIASKKPQSLAVIGTGLIGVCSGLWAKELGIGDVTVIGRNDSKKSTVIDLDLNYSLSTSDKKYDAVIEAVGSNESLKNAVSICKDGGDIVLVGNPEGEMKLSQTDYWQILRRELSLHGVWNSQFLSDEYCEWKNSIEFLEKSANKLDKLITARYDSSELKMGLQLMKNKEKPYFKVMIQWK